MSRQSAFFGRLLCLVFYSSASFQAPSLLADLLMRPARRSASGLALGLCRSIFRWIVVSLLLVWGKFLAKTWRRASPSRATRRWRGAKINTRCRCHSMFWLVVRHLLLQLVARSSDIPGYQAPWARGLWLVCAGGEHI